MQAVAGASPTNWNRKAFENGWGFVQTGILPGTKRPHLHNWQNRPPCSLEQAEDDDRRGCGIGIRCGIPVDPFSGNVIVGVDIDVTDVRACTVILTEIVSLLGDAPRRIGRPPKVLLPYRVTDIPKDMELRKNVWSFVVQDVAHKVEILAKGQQFVAAGVHPDTGKPFTRTPDFLDSAPFALPAISLETLVELGNQMGAILAKAGAVSMSSPVSGNNLVDAHPDRERWELSAEQTQFVLQHMPPNDPTTFDYDTWVSIMHAIQNVTDPHPGLDGEDWWVEWSRDGDPLDPSGSLARHKWNTVRNSRAGLTTLLKAIERKAGLKAREDVETQLKTMQAQQEFDAPAFQKPPVSPGEQLQNAMQALFNNKVRVWGNMGRDPVPWIDNGKLLMRGGVTLLAGRPGEGKSLFALNYVLDLISGNKAISTGTINDQQIKCLYVSAEDDAHMVGKRIKAYELFHGGSRTEGEGTRSLHKETGGEVRQGATAGKHTPGQFDGRMDCLAIGTTGFENLTLSDPNVINALIDHVKTEKYDAVLVDPLSNVMKLEDENDNARAMAVMQSVTRLAGVTKAAVLLVHHVRKGATAESDRELEQSDIRGAGAFMSVPRIGKMLQSMTARVAKQQNVPEHMRFNYVRVIDVKKSYGKMDASGDWFEKLSISLNNAANGYPSDDIPVVVPWHGIRTGLPDVRVIQDFLGELEAAPHGVYSDHQTAPLDRDVYHLGEKLGMTRQQVQDTLAHLTDKEYIERGKRHSRTGFLVQNLVYNPDDFVQMF